MPGRRHESRTSRSRPRDDSSWCGRPRPLPPGGYFLSYRVTSLDAHAVGATLRFGVGGPAPGRSAEPGGRRHRPRLAAAGPLAALRHRPGRRRCGAVRWSWSGRRPARRARVPTPRGRLAAVGLLAPAAAARRGRARSRRSAAAGACTSRSPGPSPPPPRWAPASVLGGAGPGADRRPRRRVPGWALAAGAVAVAAQLRAHRPCRLGAAALADRARAGPARAVRRLLARLAAAAAVEPCACRPSRPARSCGASRAWRSRPSPCSVAAGARLAWIQLGGDAGQL